MSLTGHGESNLWSGRWFTNVRLCATSLQFPLPGQRGEPHWCQQTSSQTAVGGQKGEGFHVCQSSSVLPVCCADTPHGSRSPSSENHDGISCGAGLVACFIVTSSARLSAASAAQLPGLLRWCGANKSSTCWSLCWVRGFPQGLI